MSLSPVWVPAQLVARRPESWRGEVLYVEAEEDVVAGFTRAGQYCLLRVGDEVGHYAIARAPGPGLLEFYVQRGGGASQALHALPVGAALQITPPEGPGYGVEEALRTDGRFLILVTGSGLASLRGCLDLIHAAGRPFTLYYGCRGAGDFIYLPDLLRYQVAGAKVHLTLSRREIPDWHGRVGYVGELVSAEAHRLGNTFVFLCGVPEMQHSLTAWLQTHGVPRERIRTNF